VCDDLIWDKGPGHDTVGCVALDTHGHLASAGSTGGIAGKMAGRIGDTPLPGCGFYADDERGAVACSGDGESIARVIVASHAIHVLSRSPTQAAQSAIDQISRVGGEAGVILIDPAGRMGIAHNSEQFSLGIAASWLAMPQGATHAADLKEWLE
jgi:beta-aspartyl-peptidase (threonine type)